MDPLWASSKHTIQVGHKVTVDGYGKDPRELVSKENINTPRWCATHATLETKTMKTAGRNQIIFDPNNPRPLVERFRECLRERGPLPVQLLYGHIHGKNQSQVKQIIKTFPNVFEVKGSRDIVNLRTRFGEKAKVVSVLREQCLAAVADDGEEVLVPHNSFPSDVRKFNKSLLNYLKPDDMIRVDMEGQDKCDYEPGSTVTPKWKARTAVQVSDNKETNKPRNKMPTDNTHLDQETTNAQDLLGIETKARLCHNVTRTGGNMEKEAAVNPSEFAPSDSETTKPSVGSRESNDKADKSHASNSCKYSDKELMMSIRDVLLEQGPTTVDCLWEKHPKSKVHKALLNKEALKDFIRSAPKAFIVMQTNGKVHVKKLVNVPATITSAFHGYCFASLTQRPGETIFIPYGTMQHAKEKWIDLCYPNDIGRVVTVDGYGRDPREFFSTASKQPEWCATKAVLACEDTDTDKVSERDNLENNLTKVSKGEEYSVIDMDTSKDTWQTDRIPPETTSTQTKAKLDTDAIMNPISINTSDTTGIDKKAQVFAEYSFSNLADIKQTTEKGTKPSPEKILLGAEVENFCNSDLVTKYTLETSASSLSSLAESERIAEKDTKPLPEKIVLGDSESAEKKNCCEKAGKHETASLGDKCKLSDEELIIALRKILLEKGPIMATDLRWDVQRSKSHTAFLSIEAFEKFIKGAPKVFILQPNGMVHLEKLENTLATITAVFWGFCFASVNEHPQEDIYIPFKTFQPFREGQIGPLNPTHIGCMVAVDAYGKDPRELMGTSCRKAGWCATKAILCKDGNNSDTDSANTANSCDLENEQTETQKDEEQASVKEGGSIDASRMVSVPTEMTTTQIVYDPDNPKHLLDKVRTCLREKGSLPISSLYGRIHGKNQRQVKQIIQQFPNVFEIKGQQDVVHLRERFDVEAKVVIALEDDYIARIEGGKGEEVLIPHSLLPFDHKSQVQFLEDFLEQGDVVKLDMEGQDKCDYEPDASRTPKWKARKITLGQAMTDLHQAESIGVKDQTGSTASLAQQLTGEIIPGSRESENICQSDSTVGIQRSSSSDLLPTHSQETSSTSSIPYTAIPNAAMNAAMPVAPCPCFQIASSTVGPSCQTKGIVPEPQVMSNTSAACQVVVNTADASCQTELTGHVVGTRYITGIS